MNKINILVMLVLLAASVFALGGAIGGIIYMPQIKNNYDNYVFHQQLDNLDTFSYECSDIERIIWEPGTMEVLNICEDDPIRNIDLELTSAMKKGYLDIIMIGKGNTDYLGLNNVYHIIDVRMNGNGDAALTVRLSDSDYTIYKQVKTYQGRKKIIEWVDINAYIDGNDYSFEVENEGIFAAAKNEE